MNTKSSHYYRLFHYIMVTIMIILTITGVLIVGICSKLYKNSELNNIKNIGTFYADCISGDDFNDYSAGIRQNIIDSNNVKICIYDDNGKCIIPDCEYSRYIDESLRLRIANDNEVLELRSASISNDKPYLLFGRQLTLKEKQLYMLVYGDTDSIDAFNIKTTLAYTVLALLAFIISYIIIKKKMNCYIRFESDFMRIVEKYSKGDFSEKLSTDLSPNLQHISERVNTIASNIEKSEEISSTFIANVSHELRTPMTTIGGFVDGILDGTIKKSHQQEYLILVSQEIQRLRILITSMLNMSKFESGTMSPNFCETNLTELVIKVVLMFEKKIEEKNLSVEELDSNRLTAVADPDLMQQVIYNLVENAVKFVNTGGTLSFSFEKKDNICIIGIRNTGEGLNDSEIQQVFNRFYKTDSSRGKDKTGLGLGLSISRKIVHLHNGHIVVKSVYGEYTEFQIQIPENPQLVNKEK